MTNLTIYRGETLIAQVTLTGKAMKLGRSKDNDIVLEDPGKGVSRVHAELRAEGDRYRLVDLDSQNGIWVSGKRVPSVVLAPGVVAAMGPFRVAVDATSPMTQMYTPIKDEIITQTEYSRPLASIPMPPSEPVAVDGAGELLDDLGPTGGTRPPVMAQDVTSPPATPPKKAEQVPPPPRGAAASKSDGTSRTLWVALAAVVLMAASGFGAYKLLLRKATPQPVWDSAAATTLVNSGRCQEALDQQINRALAANPNDALALDLKQKCSTPPPPPPVTSTIPAVVTKTNAEKLDDAEASLQAKACQAALDTANEVLIADANDERAKGVAKKAADCLKPPSTPGTTASAGDTVVKVPPAQGGLEPQPGETGKDYRGRVAAMRKRYDDAVALLQAQRFIQAAREFDAINAVVPAGYLDLAQRRAEVRSSMREESKSLYTAGTQAEQRSEWNTAVAAYQRAHDLDPTRDVSAEIARINEAKAKIARQLCSEADAAYALSHNSDAAEKYSKILELLPSSDSCYATAKERLALIRK